MSKQALIRAVDLANGQRALVKGVNAELQRRRAEGRRTPNDLSQQLLSYWLNKARGPVPPAEYCEPIAAAVRGQVSARDLRPDIFTADAA